MSNEYTPTIEKMRKAFAISHWDVTNEYKEGERLFDEQIAAIEAAAEQRGAIKALRDAAESDDLIHHMLANLRANQPIAVREASRYLHNRADLLEGDE